MRSSWYFRPGQRTGAARALWVVLGLIVAMFYFTRRVVVSLGAGGWVQDFDAPVQQWVLEHQDPVLAALAHALYWWGSTAGMTATMVLVTALLCWFTRSFWPLATVGFTALVSVLLTTILKGRHEVIRPDGIPGGPEPPGSFSFPSGHTLNAAALIGIAAYLAIVYGLRRYAYLIASLAVFFVLAMGFSRIYLGHHWLSDVVVGFVIGAGWAAVVAILHYYFVPSKRIRR